MTRDKAEKRAIRARMAKTGERYTTARHFHLDQHLTPPAAAPILPDVPDAPDAVETAPTSGAAALPPRRAEPGVSDEAVRRATGKAWDEWFAVLDGWDAATRGHAEIARYLWEVHGVDGWWAQSVTVGYERARGMRAPHERPDGYSVSVSKTFALPAGELYAAIVEEAGRDRWLEPGTLRVRTTQPDRSARFDVAAHGTRLNVNFVAKGEAKSSVQLQHEKLPLADDVDVWRAFWKERLERLAAVLAEAD